MHFRAFPVLKDVGQLVGTIYAERFPARADKHIGAEFFLVVEIAVFVVEDPLYKKPEYPER